MAAGRAGLVMPFDKPYKIIKRFICICIAAAAALMAAAPAFAEDSDDSWPSGISVDAQSAIVVEISTGTVLYEKNADEVHYPASITKILTTLIALENCELDEIVTFSEDAVYLNEGDTSHIARDVGEQMTMEDCLYAVMLESANECAYAVAEHVAGGDYDAFIDMMNEYAENLGCTNTNFTNCNGLPDDDHVTSARDMALISQAAYENETFRKIISTVAYTIEPTNVHDECTYLYNHHQMISNHTTSSNLYEYAIGGKTGYTSVAKNTLVTFAEKDGMTLLCVVMYCSSGTHYSSTRTLFEYCFDKFSIYNVSECETRYSGGADASADEEGSDTEGSSSIFLSGETFAVIDEDAQIVLPSSADFSDTEVEISYENAGGSVLGTLVYTYAGKEVGTADVITTGVLVEAYDFGEKEAAETSADEETAAVILPAGSAGRIALIAVVIIAAALFVIWFLYNNHRRIWRRSSDKEEIGKYKKIKKDSRWNKRGGSRT